MCLFIIHAACFSALWQEFCLFAVLGLGSDFFLQMFFFTTVLSIDIRRMEVSCSTVLTEICIVLLSRTQIRMSFS